MAHKETAIPPADNPEDRESVQEILDRLEHERLLREVVAAQRDRLAIRLQTLQSELTLTRQQLEDAATAGANAQRELEALWRSNSWRLTRPLREAGLVVRRVLRGAYAVFGRSKAAGSDQGVPAAAPIAEKMSSDAASVFDELRKALAETRRD